MSQDPERRRRKIRWKYVLAGVVIAALALYVGVWYHLSETLTTQITKAIDEENRSGKRASCENLATDGFPLGLGIQCDSILFADDAAGLSFSAGRLLSAMRIYQPLVVETEVSSPAHLEYPGLLPLDLSWDAFSSNIRLGAPFPANISVSAKNLKATAKQFAGLGSDGLFRLDAGDVELRAMGRDLDFVSALKGFSARIGKFDSKLDMNADIRIIDGVHRITAQENDLRGASVDVRQLALETPDGGMIVISGPLSIDEAGFANGQLSLEIKNAQALSAGLAEIAPDAAEQIGTMIGLVAPPQNGGKGRIEIRIVKGRIYAGLFAVGKIPPFLSKTDR
jgi:hypothetical protein